MLKIDDLPPKLAQNYVYEVSELWSVLGTDGYTPVNRWLKQTGIDAVAYEGYGLLRFRRSEDRTMFLLAWSVPNDTVSDY